MVSRGADTCFVLLLIDENDFARLSQGPRDAPRSRRIIAKTAEFLAGGVTQRPLIATYSSGLRTRQVVMNTRLLTVIIVIALIVGGGLRLQKACTTGHHAWCEPESYYKGRVAGNAMK